MFQILIVEDDKELSQLFQKVLEKNGYQPASEKRRISMGLEINKNFKDTLFRKIFDNKKDLLSLYNALNDTCLLYTSRCV